MRTRTGIVTAIVLAGLSACGGPEPEPGADDAAVGAAPAEAPEAVGAQTAAGPPAAFAVCRSCHAVEPGRHGIGPSLAGVYGRPAASLPGYSYSPALQKAGLTWDAATLDRWLADTRGTVPGTKMVFAGMPDAARRKQMIDYLASLK